jgi:hypothetical protein
VRFIEKIRRALVYTNFEDELGAVSVVDLPGVPVGTNWERFKAKARAYLREHEDDVDLQRLRRNKQLTDSDLSALEQMLIASGAGGAEDIGRARGQAQGLGLFIRSLVGLDRTAATEAFSEFLNDSRGRHPQRRPRPRLTKPDGGLTLGNKGRSSKYFLRAGMAWMTVSSPLSRTRIASLDDPDRSKAASQIPVRRWDCRAAARPVSGNHLLGRRPETPPGTGST